MLIEQFALAFYRSAIYSFTSRKSIFARAKSIFVFPIKIQIS